MYQNILSQKIIGFAIEIHKVLGPGLLEHVYKECLFQKILKSGLQVEKEKILPVVFDDIRIDCACRVDLMVENQLILEIKCVEDINSVHIAQLLTYLRLAKCKLGLLINFNELLLHQGIKRVVNDL